MKRVELKLVLLGGTAASQLFVAAAQVLPNQTYFRQTIFGLDFNSKAWKCDQIGEGAEEEALKKENILPKSHFNRR